MWLVLKHKTRRSFKRNGTKDQQYHQRRETVLSSTARNREPSMRACVRGCKGFAEHVQHPGLPFRIQILHVIVPFNSTTTQISPRCLSHIKMCGSCIKQDEKWHCFIWKMLLFISQEINPTFRPYFLLQIH